MTGNIGHPETACTDAARPGRRLLRVRPGVHRYSVAYFLAALVLLFVTAPFVEQMKSGEAIAAVMMTLVLASGVLAVGGRPRTLAWGIVLAVPAVAAEWIDRFLPGAVPSVVISGAGLTFVAYIIFQLFRFILRASRVGSEVLCAAVGVYLLLALLWAMAYSLTDDLMPGAFAINPSPAAASGIHGFNAVYYSVMTLATVGYGDITPVAGPARMLAMLEAMAGIFYITLLMARLVTLYSADVPAPPHAAKIHASAAAPHEPAGREQP